MTQMQELSLLKHAAQIRLDVLDSVYTAGSGHIGGSLSAADILTLLYFSELRIRPENPGWPERDRFVLSKGHAAPALYAALAERGYFAKEELLTLRKLHSRLQGHPNMNLLPGIDMTTGSLGQGLSAAVGMALAAKLQGSPARVYVLLGDGEMEEGQVWEAIMFASQQKLDNLRILIDRNGLQLDGKTADILNLEPLEQRLAAFGCHTIRTNGHSFPAMQAALLLAADVHEKPCAMILDTIKGRGVPFMEGNVAWHGKAPNETEYTEARLALTAQLQALEQKEELTHAFPA